MVKQKIGFGGGCHWCTEAVFQALPGVLSVDQGWISPAETPDSFSEAVSLTYDPESIELGTLIAVHLKTHASTSMHTLRSRYRSAIYVHSARQRQQVERILRRLQAEFDEPLITRAVRFGRFRASPERYRNYYHKNPERPFCQTYISPKLALLDDVLSAPSID